MAVISDNHMFIKFVFGRLGTVGKVLKVMNFGSVYSHIIPRELLNST